jgi:hypothetical protein
LIIDEHDLRSLKSDDHIGFMIAVDIEEAEGHCDEVSVCSVELGADVDTGVAGVTAWQFDDLDPPMQVDSQKMCCLTSHMSFFCQRICRPILVTLG